VSGRLAAGLLLALASAGLLNAGYFVQYGGAVEAPALSLRHPIHSLWSLVRNVRWLVGNVVVFAGFVLYIVALHFAAISIVQATSAGGIGLLAILVARVGHTPLSRREWTGVWIALAGLALLGISLTGGRESEAPGAVGVIVTWVVGAGLVAGLAAGPLARLLAAGAGLGSAAGILFATGDVATKAALVGGVRWWFAPVALAFYAAGFVAMQFAFQRGGALVTAGLASLFTNALPIVAGIVVYHDPVPGGLLGAVRIASFVSVIGGAVALARPEPTHAVASTSDGLR